MHHHPLCHYAFRFQPSRPCLYRLGRAGAYHLEPGQTMTLTLKKESRPDSATGISETSQVPFRWDIHTHMKGEFLVLETRGEGGGG